MTSNTTTNKKILGFCVKNPNGKKMYAELCKLSSNTETMRNLFRHWENLKKSEKELLDNLSKSLNMIKEKLLTNRKKGVSRGVCYVSRVSRVSRVHVQSGVLSGRASCAS